MGIRARRRLATLAFCALVVQGCAYGRPPRIDPSGEHFFIPGPIVYDEEPRPPLPHHERHELVKLSLTPSKIVAPVGSEVVLLAAVCGADGCMYANQEVEWMLAPGGAGQFIALGRKSPLDWLVGFSNWPRKVNGSYAIGTTSARYLCLTRGTPTPADDMPVQRGQAWISLTSPVEGVSYVTAHAPGVQAWDGHVQTATVYWVDAEFVYPPPAINPAGSKHVFTTTLARHSTHAPIEGWRVRYEITGGPPAGFAPDGAKVVEVPTNELGQASVEIYQLEPAPGTNTIGIQVIRPSDGSAGGERFIVGNGGTHKTWSTPGLSLRKTGPERGVVGDTLVYRIEVRNPGDLTCKGIVVTDQLSEGLTFLGSNPPVQPAGGQLQWPLGDLLSGEGRTIEVNLRAERPGTVNNCATAASADKLTAQDCAATTVVVQTLQVELSGPPQVAVGQEVAFQARITNTAGIAATGLVIVGRYDPGLRHAAGQNPIERTLGDLQPGETKLVDITFVAVQAGELCHTIEIHAPGGGAIGSAKACVTAAAPAAPAPAPPPAAAAPAVPGGRPDLVVHKTGPVRMNVGETAKFTIEIVNQGQGAATKLKIIDHYDASLNPTDASPGSKWTGADLQWDEERLEPGASIRLGINCQCTAPAAKSCNRVTVTCQEQVRDDAEACLVISPPPGGVSVVMAEKADPLRVGEQTSYEITVANYGQTADGQVAVVVTVPPEMTPLRIRSQGPDGATMTIDGQTVRFSPVAELRAGDELHYSVQVRAEQASDQARCRVEVTTRNQKSPLAQEETTRIIPVDSGQFTGSRDRRLFLPARHSAPAYRLTASRS
ncbi:MAG TPA: DUF11 domain-containing protein [Pirellulales bacterium]|nr:DUF11 domain-containing protein [Pirellulales bacterium]